jgi:cathepsin A (carboxypeptidase C)
MRIVTGLLVLLAIVSLVGAAPTADFVDSMVNWNNNQTLPFRMWSGYLQVNNTDRNLHYVFMERTINGAGQINNSAPVMLWLNGGPGCSSLLGMVTEVGPWVFVDGESTIFYNNYTWLEQVNLLFLEAPAGVGFSYLQNTSYVYNDTNTAEDNFAALLNFFTNKFPEYVSNNFWIAGES